MKMLDLILLGFIIVILYVALILFKNTRYWSKLKIPNVPPIKLFKMMFTWLTGKKHLSALLNEIIYKAYPNQTFVGMFATSVGFMIIRDPKLVRTIMNTDFPYFIDRIPYNLDEERDLLATDLNNLTGSRWKIIRNKLLPVFTPSKLKQMFPLIEDCVSEFDEYLSIKIQKDNNIELKGLIDAFITNVSFKLTFGINYNTFDELSNKLEELKYLLHDSTTRVILLSILKSLSPRIVSALNLRISSQRLEHLMVGMVEEYRQNRGSQKRNDFLQLLIDIQEQESHKNLNKSTAFSNAILFTNIKHFILTNLEVSANTIIYCIYELALNQDIQSRLQTEIRSTLSNPLYKQQLTYEIVNSLPYLELVLKETLRKYTSIPLTARSCTKDYTIPGTNTVLKKGTKLFIPLYSYHNDPQYFPQPQTFDPDRFLNWDKNNPSYIPFGNGPRMCIAMRMAKTTIKFILISLLQNYTFLPTEKTEIPIRFDGKSLTLVPKNGVYLKVIRKNHHSTIPN